MIVIIAGKFFTELKQNIGGHIFKDDREKETGVTRWMIIQGSNFCQQGTEMLAP
jgi:hypothetical protein